MIKTTQIKSFIPKEPTSYSIRESRYQEGHLNTYQNFLYRRAMYGLTVYNEKQLSTMNPHKKFKIMKVQRHAHEVLNSWKQELLTQETNDILGSLFPNSNLVKELVFDYSEPDPKFKCKLPIESFGLSKMDIVDKFIEKGVLPQDFPVLEDVE